jgi:general secretion pathway protein A
MFLEYYDLREQPFGVTPDPRFLYFGATHREALASLFYGIESGCGFLALIAPPGMGKTTLLFHLLEKLRGSAQTVFLFQTQCGSREMFRHLLNDLGIDSKDQDLATMHESLNSVLLANARKGRRVVLVIDESQNLRDSVLETVRLLSDFETPQAKLLQIVLSGQPQLADKLAHPGLTQLRQRISVISRLQPFTRVETMVYIEYRLCRAGYSGPPLFSYAAVDLIAAGSKGIPRTINNLCFNALTLGFAKRQRQIDAETVREVLADLDLDGLTVHHSTSQDAAEEALSSFDGISPSSDLTYQDFHDAVRAAWGNGAPIKTEIGPAQDRPLRVGSNGAARPVDAVVRMSLDTNSSSGSSEPSMELQEEQERKQEVDAEVFDSLPISEASALALSMQPSHQAEPHVKRSKPAPTPVATPEARRQKTTEPTPPNAPIQSPLSTAPRKGQTSLRSSCGSVFRTMQEAFKKAADTAEKRRAIRGGTVVSILFALVVSTVVFARHRGGSAQPLTSGVAATPAPNSARTYPPGADARDAQAPANQASLPRAKSNRKQAATTSADVQAAGGASLAASGRFNSETTKQIQNSARNHTDPKMFYSSSQTGLPAPQVRADIGAPVSGDLPNRVEERQ